MLGWDEFTGGRQRIAKVEAADFATGTLSALNKIFSITRHSTPTTHRTMPSAKNKDRHMTWSLHALAARFHDSLVRQSNKLPPKSAFAPRKHVLSRSESRLLLFCMRESFYRRVLVGYTATLPPDSGLSICNVCSGARRCEAAYENGTQWGGRRVQAVEPVVR